MCYDTNYNQARRQHYSSMVTFRNEKLPHINVKYIMQTDAKMLPDLLTAGGAFDIMISSVGLTPNFLTTYDLQYDISDLIEV
jgi:hypothetical protein